jgi:hypothetical protein
MPIWPGTRSRPPGPRHHRAGPRGLGQRLAGPPALRSFSANAATRPPAAARGVWRSMTAARHPPPRVGPDGGRQGWPVGLCTVHDRQRALVHADLRLGPRRRRPHITNPCAMCVPSAAKATPRWITPGSEVCAGLPAGIRPDGGLRHVPCRRRICRKVSPVVSGGNRVAAAVRGRVMVERPPERVRRECFCWSGHIL